MEIYKWFYDLLIEGQYLLILYWLQLMLIWLVLEYYSCENDSPTIERLQDSVDNPLDMGLFDRDADSDMTLLLDGIRDPIDCLYKLSTWIRNPSFRFASSKMQNYRQIDPETGVDFLQAVERFVWALSFLNIKSKEYERSARLYSHQNIVMEKTKWIMFGSLSGRCFYNIKPTS